MTSSRTKPIHFIFSASMLFYVVLTLWRMQWTPFPLHADACWYDMVARNLALGRGLTEDCVWYFSIPFKTVSHPIGNLFNPLAPIITAGFYRLFGISNWAGVMPVFLMDGILCACIFWFSWSRFRSLSIAFFSSLLFTSHKFLYSVRAGGGVPEAFLMFFLTLCCYALIWAWEGQRKHYLTAAFWGALAYLARNEGGLSIAVIGCLFAYREIYVPWKSGQTIRSSSLAIGIGALLVFVAIVLPWEIRNHTLFGPYANAAKYNFFLTRQYEDIWSYSQTFSIPQFFAMGWKTVLTKYLTSYYYKLESFVEITSWPLIMFFPAGYLALKGQRWPVPILFYFLFSFAVMGILNQVSQQSGYNGLFAFLPFWIPMALAGVRYFSEHIIPDRARAARWAAVFSTGIVLFHLGDNARQLHRLNKAGGDAKQMMVRAIENWWASSHQKPPEVVMTHFAYAYTYYSGIPSVKIPANDPMDKVWEVADKYKCTHLILIGDNDAVFSRIYNGSETHPRLERLGVIAHRIAIEHGGDQIQIYRIRSI